MSELVPVAILFARKDSVYKTMQGVDVWDEERDARRWPGGCAIVAHPPCAQWSRLYKFARKCEETKNLAVFAIEQVRRFGGVVEHPYKSRLWGTLRLPLRQERDEWGGYTIAMPQFWFGHPANKATWFYIVGCAPTDLPVVQLKLGRAELCVTTSRGNRGVKEMKKSERTRTYLPMAEWLVAVARKCRPECPHEPKTPA